MSFKSRVKGRGSERWWEWRWGLWVWWGYVCKMWWTWLCHVFHSSLVRKSVPVSPLATCDIYTHATVLYDTIRYDTIEEIKVDSKAEYSASYSTHMAEKNIKKKKLKQTKAFNSVQVNICEARCCLLQVSCCAHFSDCCCSANTVLLSLLPGAESTTILLSLK